MLCNQWNTRKGSRNQERSFRQKDVRRSAWKRTQRMLAQRRMYHPVVSPGLGKSLRSLLIVMIRRGMPRETNLQDLQKLKGQLTRPVLKTRSQSNIRSPARDNVRVIKTFVGARSERCQKCRDSSILVRGAMKLVCTYSTGQDVLRKAEITHVVTKSTTRKVGGSLGDVDSSTDSSYTSSSN